MAFPKKRAYNQTYNSIGSKYENDETNRTILRSLFSDLKKVETVVIDDDNVDSSESSLSNSGDYILPSSPVCMIDTAFDTSHLHTANCPKETKKPTNIRLYTRYNSNFSSNLKEPTYYLVWYNVIISTGYRNCQEVRCASVKIEVSTIVGSSGFKMPHPQQNICCETLYTNNIETVGNIRDSIYLDSITNKTESIFEKTSLSSIFTHFYNVLLSLFEEVYPNCIMFGLNNIVVKNKQIDTNRIFSSFLEKIKEQYNFYYKQINNKNLTNDIQKIQSWLLSPIVEDFNSQLNSSNDSLDFLSLLE